MWLQGKSHEGGVGREKKEKKKKMNFPSAGGASSPGSASGLTIAVSSGSIKNMWPRVRGSGAAHPGCNLYTGKTKQTVKLHHGEKGVLLCILGIKSDK